VSPIDARRVRRLIKDAGYGLGIHSLRLAVGSLSDRAAGDLGRWLGRRAARIAASDFARARRQFAAAFPERSPSEVDENVLRCFEHLGMCVVEILRFDRLTTRNIADRVELVGREHIDAARERGNGFIGLTGHYGNWELLAAALVLNGIPVSAIARDLRSRTLGRLLVRQRSRVGVESISRDGGAREAVRALRANHALGVLADVDTSVQSVTVDFFGRPAKTPVGPVRLSQRFGSPAIPLFLTRLDDGRHRLDVHPPIVWQDTGDPDADLVANTSAFTRVIESQIRRVPHQWIWMHPRWKSAEEASS